MSNSSTMEALKASQQLYIDGEFDKAIEKTLEAKESMDSGLFHYNLGSMYLKKGELGPARFHMEKAKSLNFSYPMLWKNLNFINAQREVLDPKKTKIFSEKFIGHYMDIPAIVFTSTMALVLIFTILGARLRKLSNGFIVALCILSVIPWGVKLYLSNTYKFAVVIEDGRVYEGPSKIFQDYGLVPEGSRVIVGKYHDKWYYILSPKDFSGWVNKKSLGFY